MRFLNTLSLRRGVPVTKKAVKAALEMSLRRMGVERLDLVQLCWWVCVSFHRVASALMCFFSCHSWVGKGWSAGTWCSYALGLCSLPWC